MSWDFRTKKFPHLTTYLKYVAEESTRSQLRLAGPKALLGGLLVFGLLVAVFSGLGFLYPGLFWGGLAGALSIGGIGQWEMKRRERSDPDFAKKRSLAAIGFEMTQLTAQRKLHKWMDPVALQLLEAAAYHWERLHTALNSPHWSDRDLPQYWKGVRTQAMEASNMGMMELVLLCRGCMGPPQKDKQSEIQGIMQDFVDLDIADALQGLKSMAKSDWTVYAHKSPVLDQIFEPARQIAEKIKLLADEIETKNHDLLIAKSPIPERRAVDSIDSVLTDLRAFDQAEDELESRLQQGN